MKIGKTLEILAFLTLFLISSIGYINNSVVSGDDTELPTKYPVVYVYPEFVTAEVGETFTISVIAYNLTDARVPDPDSTSTIPLGNLYGFDIQFTWDPTVIQYVNYTNPGSAIGANGYRHPNVTAPIANYSQPIPPSPYPGILHGYGSGEKQLFVTRNVVNETGNLDPYRPEVRAWFSYATLTPATPFNGNGTIFVMTFKVLKKGASQLEIVALWLADKDGNPIGQTSLGRWLNPPRSGTFRSGAPVASFTYWPNIGVVNKTMYFNASVTENITAIETYMWDFGDGTKMNTTTPTAEHNYTTADTRTASLKVVDTEGVESILVTQEIIVANYRDLKATSVTLSQSTIRPNNTLTITTRVDNIGSPPGFNENCTVTLSYNASSIDWGNLANATWIPVDTNQMLIKNYKLIPFTLNSSDLPTLDAHYYFLANATGIPNGYEANTTNNVKISDALLYTNQTIHMPFIASFRFGYETTAGALKVPVIEGENTTFSITVKNDGNVIDKFNVTLYANSSAIETGQTSDLQPGASQTITLVYKLNSGYYNLTVEAKVEDATVVRYDNLRVIKPPQLVIVYTPELPKMNDQVVFNCSASIHQDPEGIIKIYTWKIFAPGLDPSLASPTKTFPNATLISYTFNLTGKWTIVLEVTDNIPLKYDSKRPATSAYRKEITFTIEQAGFPIEWIIAIVVVVVVAIAVIAFVLLRRRRPKPIE